MGRGGRLSGSRDFERSGDDEEDEMEARLRWIRADVGRLGVHVIATAACGLVIFLFAMVRPLLIFSPDIRLLSRWTVPRRGSLPG
jgi:hypothetical protein